MTISRTSQHASLLLIAAVLVGGGIYLGAPETPLAQSSDQPSDEQVLRGRQLVLSRACGGCHGGKVDPSAERWLAGASPEAEGMPVYGYTVYAPNLTPDRETGIGRFSDRQLFNSLRYGLSPADSPDIEITSTVPGEGGHPAEPSYLAPAMPWYAWRHMSDQQLWDIIAYLRHGVNPVTSLAPASDRPADGWVSAFTAEKIGSYPLAPFPTANEELRDETRREQVQRGRVIVAQLDCGGCHGGGANPAASGWLAGLPAGDIGREIGPFEIEFPVGPFVTRPRNITPDNLTGIGRFTERQLFNALRWGLRPGETPDVEITSSIPGVGNHPDQPKYLAPPMPWPEWRHLTDDEIRDIVAYLKEGVKPVRNRVADSDGPPDFWREAYSVEQIGPYPPPPFPTVRERRTD